MKDFLGKKMVTTLILMVMSGVVYSGFGDVRVEFGATVPPKPAFSNTTSSAYQIGGWRFSTPTNHWNTIGLDGADASCVNNADRTFNGQVETEAVFNRNAPPWLVKLPIANNFWNNVAYKWTATMTEAAQNPYILLKTGSGGLPDMPIGELPITLSQIDSLIKLPNFYNAAYRYKTFNGIPYYDSLGALGGYGSGGFLDTYRDQTQTLLAFDHQEFTFNTTDKVSFEGKSTDGPLYWMSLAICQEYFNVDMQFMMGFGAKETKIGMWDHNFDKTAYSPITAGEGIFQVQPPTGCDRAIACPYFYPKHAVALSSAPDVTNFLLKAGYVSAAAWQAEYFGPDLMQMTSAYIVNAMIFSVNVQYANYNCFGYSTEICWKDFLITAKDRNAGGVAMMVFYNMGLWSGQTVCEMLKLPNYAALAANPNASSLLPNGNNNYKPDLLTAFRQIVGAAKKCLTDASVELYDAEISRTDLLRMFFGDGGTATAQGKGGLLVHFNLNRQEVWNTLNAAFDKLKGRSPITLGKETISFRYDLLTALRTVKQYFDPLRLYQRPAGGDVLARIIFNSKSAGCPSNKQPDEKYPYLDVVTMVPSGIDIAVEATVEDNLFAKEVSYTINYNWPNMKIATPVTGGTDQKKNFKFTVTKKEIDDNIALGDGISGRFVWLLATDASGNTTVKKYPLKLVDKKTLDSCAAQDVSGDGIADQVTAYITQTIPDTIILNEWVTYQYSWPTQTALKNAQKTQVTIKGSTLVLSDPLLTEGAGLGKAKITYDSVNILEKDIVDRVGPALMDEAVLKAKSAPTDLDSLDVFVTEPIRENLADNTAYLLFNKKGAQKSIKAVKLSKTGWRFLFPADTVKGNDSVGFVYNSGVLDSVNNPPHNANRKVPIRFMSDKPTLDSCVAQDANGDGLPDQISSYLTPGGQDIGKWTVYQYAWPDQAPLKDAVKANVQAVKRTLVCKDPLLSGPAGFGKAVVAFDSLSFTKNVWDRIGPALRDSAYLKSKSSDSDPDSLYVLFNEQLKNALANNTPYLNFNVTGQQPSVAAVRQTVTRWLFVFAAGTVEGNDSVKLVYGTNNGLMDTVGNPPQTNNHYVPIRVGGKKAPSWAIGYVKDTIGNGVGNKITVTIKPGDAPDADKPTDCKSYQYSWPTQATLVWADMTKLVIAGNDLIYYDNTLTLGGDKDLGKGILEFPSKKDLTGNLIDSVGPAITTAVLYESVDITELDTLIVGLTEPIKENLAGNQAYLNVNGASTVSLKAEKQTTAATWMFVFPNSTIHEGDEVNLIATSGIVDIAFDGDPAHNKPLENNKKVKVILRKEKYKVAEGYYCDADANGIMDSIALRFNKAIKQVDLESISFEFIWLKNAAGQVPITLQVAGKDFTIAAGDARWVSIGKLQGVYALKKDCTSLGSVWGQATIKQPDVVNNQVVSVTDNILLFDAMAPVIVKADYFAHGLPNIAMDTLQVDFSENVDKTVNTAPFRLLCTSLLSEYSLNMTNYAGSGAALSFTVTAATGGYPNSGDSIWIHQAGGIKDTSPKQNVQLNQKNKKVVLNVVRYFMVKSAAYFDTDVRPDGWIEEIRVVMTDSVVPGIATIKKLFSITTLPLGRGFDPLSEASFFLTGNGFIIRVHQAKDVADNQYYNEVSTDVSTSDILAIGKTTGLQDTEIIMPANVQIDDSLAPVIKYAVFKFPYLTDENAGSNPPEILRITYSEKVKSLPSGSPFRFKTGALNQSREYSMTLQQQTSVESDENSFIVTQRDQVPGIRDSIWILGQSALEDKMNNKQKKDTRPVKLKLEYNNYYSVKVFPNPLLREDGGQRRNMATLSDPDHYNISPKPEKDAVAIIIKPYGYLGGNISGKVSIVDPLGNVILKGADLVSTLSNKKGQIWYYLWNTKNDAMRNVGGGIYKCFISITEINDSGEEIKKDKKVIIGVGGK
jgi:hypothetical protein